MNKRGFTIVELLIVIVVIAILASISVVAYNGIQTRARDSQRSSDISAIKKALELLQGITPCHVYAQFTKSQASWPMSTLVKNLEIQSIVAIFAITMPLGFAMTPTAADLMT